MNMHTATDTTLHIHPGDRVLVILDAISAQKALIARNPDHEPWGDYDGDSTDPKTSRESYLALLDEAHEAATRLLETGTWV